MGRHNSSLRQRLAVLYAGSALLIAIVGTMLVLYDQTAAVVVQVGATKISTDFRLNGMPNGSGANFPTQAVQVDGSVSLNDQPRATGQKQIAAVAATGDVAFTYGCPAAPCSNVVVIPAGTTVKTAAGLSFTTQAVAVLQGNPGTAVAKVSALVAGPSGNVAAASIVTVSPPVQGVTVSNPAPLGGGAEARSTTVFSTSDIDSIKSTLYASLLAKLNAEMLAKHPGHLVASSQPSLTYTGPAAGDEATGFVVPGLSGTLAGLTFDEQAVLSQIRDALKPRVPAGSRMSDDPINASYMVVAATSDGKVALQCHASGYAVPIFRTDELRTQLAGATPNEARAKLARVNGFLDFHVRQSPLPLPFLPVVDSHIAIRFVVSPAATTT